MKSIFELCGVVRETAYAIHVYLGHGHLEKVYENALAHRLRKLGLDVKQQYSIQVRDEDGTIIGDFVADLLVNNLLLIELKAAKTLGDEHIAQLLGYLKSTRLEHGMLINFGSYKFQIKKYVKSRSSSDELLADSGEQNLQMMADASCASQKSVNLNSILLLFVFSAFLCG